MKVIKTDDLRFYAKGNRKDRWSFQLTFKKLEKFINKQEFEIPARDLSRVKAATDLLKRIREAEEKGHIDKYGQDVKE